MFEDMRNAYDWPTLHYVHIFQPLVDSTGGNAPMAPSQFCLPFSEKNHSRLHLSGNYFEIFLRGQSQSVE